MDIAERAISLLEDWGQYKNLHYSSKTHFSNAIDIEVEKNAIAIFAGDVRLALRTDTWDNPEFERTVNRFDEHLTMLKDRITFELLRNGT